jgi:predicted nucleic acid-binding protein
VIAADTSTFVAYLEGAGGADVELFEGALADHQIALPPVVLTELLSAPRLPKDLGARLMDLPLLAIEEGYWERAGRLRSRVLAGGRKARIADALIAQSCVDNEVRLITRDRDFRSFVRIVGLRLAIP